MPYWLSGSGPGIPNLTFGKFTQDALLLFFKQTYTINEVIENAVIEVLNKKTIQGLSFSNNLKDFGDSFMKELSEQIPSNLLTNLYLVLY